MAKISAVSSLNGKCVVLLIHALGFAPAFIGLYVCTALPRYVTSMFSYLEDITKKNCCAFTVPNIF